METAPERLLESGEPSIRFRARTEILSEPADSAPNRRLRAQVRDSEKVRLLLSERRNGNIPFHPYAKWFGAHWVLSSLADLCYPPGDRSLIPLRDQVYEWLFSKAHMEYARRHEPHAGPYMTVRGLTRAHASMEGNAIHYLNSLGLADDRTSALTERLAGWQWPDGGWNCDKSTKAHTSSFTESLLPLRGLATHARFKGGYGNSIGRAAEYFLERDLFRKKSDGKVISPRFTKLHYPCYWHYDILFGLKVMKEAGFLRDERCGEASSILLSKRLADGGFPAEERYYHVGRKASTGRSLVSWGGVGIRRTNEFVTCDALSVLSK